VYGGPEYSNRGGLQLFTRSLVFQRDQMARFRSDAVSLARLLTSLGHLRFQADTPRRLAPVTLPDRISTAWMPDITSDADRVMVDRLLRFVDQASVAVIGANDPMAVLMAVLSRMPERGRLELSFTTGLKPSIYRPFRIQFLPSVDATLQRHLNSQGVSILEVQN